MKYEFTKISNNHERLRDDVIIANSCSEIEVGKSVFLFGAPRDGGNLRMVNTSAVTEIRKIDSAVTEVTTESGSIYQIKEIHD